MGDGILEQINANMNKNNDLIDRMMIVLEEQSLCKERLDKEIKDKFFDSFVSVLDRMLDNKQDKELDDTFKLEDLYEDLNDFMESHNLQYFKPQEHDSFDKKMHKAIKVVEIDQKELNMKIQKSTSYGYRLDNMLLKPAKVIVYKFKGE